MEAGNQSDVEKLADAVEGLNIEKKQCFIVHEFEGDDEGLKERTFLKAVEKELNKLLKEEKLDVDIKLKQWGIPGEPECKMLEDITASRCAKLILAFPEKSLHEPKLVRTINEILKAKLHFVIVIMYNDTFHALPTELKEFDMRRVEVNRKLTKCEVAIAARDLQPFVRGEPETVDLAFLNSGTGLAWSYYFGYLRKILLGDGQNVASFEDRIMKSKWRQEHPDIPGKFISKKMIIVFPHDCREPKVMSTDPKIKPSDRIKFTENKEEFERAGIKRNYDFDFREILSSDGKESYFGVIYYFNVVQALVAMKDDPNKDFCNLPEEIMRKEGKDCFEKLKLFLMKAFNEKVPKIPEEKYELIDYDPKDEDSLADKIFASLKEGPTFSDEPSAAVPAPAKVHEEDKKGVLYDNFHSLEKDIQAFIREDLKGAKTVDEYTGRDDITICGEMVKSSRIFMVLTKSYIESPCFEYAFYQILHHACDKKDKRFLVVLDCLENIQNYPKALDLRLLFSYVSYINNPDWKAKVNKELKGNALPMTCDLQFLNIGIGLALSWYYRYLKIRIPKMVDLFHKCKFLMDQFEARRMSHKVFILHPHSCVTKKLVSDVDSAIKVVDINEIKMPHVMKDTRDYTPTLYSLTDTDGKKYYAFLEFNTQADTMYRMCDSGLLPEEVMLSEWERFFNKLKTLICHEKEPMKLQERMMTIPYNDKKMEKGDLSKFVLPHVKLAITEENGKLPEIMETGATIEKRNYEKNDCARK